MIARIRRVWPGVTRTTVIAQDPDTGRERSCYVWMTSAKGPWIASICQQLENNGRGMSEQRIVLTLRPPTRFGSEIEDAELIPLEAQAS